MLTRKLPTLNRRTHRRLITLITALPTRQRPRGRAKHGSGAVPLQIGIVVGDGLVAPGVSKPLPDRRVRVAWASADDATRHASRTRP